MFQTTSKTFGSRASVIRPLRGTQHRQNPQKIYENHKFFPSSQLIIFFTSFLCKPISKTAEPNPTKIQERVKEFPKDFQKVKGHEIYFSGL